MKRKIVLAIVAGTSIVVSGIAGTQAGKQDSAFGTRGRGAGGAASSGQRPADTSPPPRQIDGVTTVRDGLYRISHSRPLEQAAKLLARKTVVCVKFCN
jgi:hypothetical protein